MDLVQGPYQLYNISNKKKNNCFLLRCLGNIFLVCMYRLKKVAKSADFTGSILNFDTCSTVFIFAAYTCKGQPKMESSVEGDKSQPSAQKFKK
jgi:hypothetical protein